MKKAPEISPGKDATFFSAFKRKKWFSSLIVLPFFIIIIIFLGNCGIYTIEGVLEPPFGLSKSFTSLKFSGYNTEEYFWGYVIWYKKKADDIYTVCGYREKFPFPTIPKIDIMRSNSSYGEEWVKYNDYTDDLLNPRIEYEVFLEDLRPWDSNKNFVELNNKGIKYYFAVSSYGINGEESEKVEFGRWPF